MEFKTQCTKNSQDATGLHHVTLVDSVTGHSIEFPSQTMFLTGETYTVTVSGKGIDKPQPKPPAPPKPPVIDKFDAQPEHGSQQPQPQG
jgi:hypothetical protein